MFALISSKHNQRDYDTHNHDKPQCKRLNLLCMEKQKTQK